MPVNPEVLYPKLINLLLDTVFVVDESGTIIFISDACEQLLGYTATEMKGTPITNYIHPDDLDRTLQAASRIMSGQSHIHFENRYLRKDGDTVNILWSARWSDDDRWRIAVARDVTALRRADQTRDAMYRISEAAQAADTLRAFCDGVREVIGQLFPGDELQLAFHDPARGMLRLPDWPSARSGSWLERPIEAGRELDDLILRAEAHQAPDEQNHRDVVPPPEQAGFMGISLMTSDTVLGAIVVKKGSKGAVFRSADRELLQFVATQVAIVAARKQAEEALRFRAHHDSLTGLTNRYLFWDRLEMALRSAARNQQRLALLCLDLNDFKRINDTWGHDAGDEVIREVARRLERGTRETDTIARMGGDEYTILLTDIGESSSVDAAVGKLRNLVAEPMDIAGEVFHVTCSIGVARYPEDGTTARELLGKADVKMYLNKKGN
ncbi:diguanylate cyclase with PAS/PAC and GAF sensors [Marinobacter daqiaonensis]|uniref:Diguanylate cyclase with PAS/PAC and GAF sensors n=1 Tax=Marinobacter daqiaonensis TaxID=650891 RepID=A0A1I6H169_9GAMM|nr:diguanylate cyclase [Marinobacter daqiaonensis]SFR48067.1 diguanylate cyclase with PAS/PAC and GAF sensors [Marinobacter daqiaonensis]